MEADIRIITKSETLDAVLEPYRAALGRDFDGYRGHLYRVLTFCLHFLNNDESYRQIVETALVFHDIGMWTDHELAYLEPSIRQALRANAEQGWALDNERIKNMITAHHKVFPYRGPDAELVNAFRKADWVDATGGKIKMGLSSKQIAAVRAAIPEHGFPQTLLRLAKELAGGNQLKGLGRVITHVYKW